MNPIANGVLSWCNVASCTSDSEVALENWQRRLHEVSTRRCAYLTRLVCWIGIEVNSPRHFDGLSEVTITREILR